MAIKVGMVSLGCSKNQVDAERMLYKLHKHGYELVEDAALADISIINTCGFIQSAKQEAIETTLEFAQLKKEGRIKKLIMTGCLAERYREEVMTEIPELDAVIGIGNNDDICDILDHVLANETVMRFDDKEKLSLTGGRIQTTLPFYSYLKIAEGCSNCCTYCAIPSIRGKMRSVPMEHLINDARQLAGYGVTELNIIAQDTTRYGEDIYGESRLPQLLDELCKIDGIRWIRLLYCYPERITDELIDRIANNDKIVKYIDMPIQHCNEDILKRMNRRGGRSAIDSAIKRLRERIPGIVLRTTLLTGFPGETEEHFEELCDFVKETRFERLGCFAYSPEEDTPAAVMDGQLDDEVKERRAEVIMDIQTGIFMEYNEKLVGRKLTVAVEGFDRYGECWFGRSALDAPDIDGKIFFTAAGKKFSIGDFVTVSINDTLDYDLIGEYTDESAE